MHLMTIYILSHLIKFFILKQNFNFFYLHYNLSNVQIFIINFLNYIIMFKILLTLNYKCKFLKDQMK